MTTSSGNPAASDALKQLITDRRNGVVLLLDGLDEIATNEETSNLLCEWIERIRQAVGSEIVEGVRLSRLITSSRPNVFREMPHFYVVKLEALDEKTERSMVQQYLEAWHVRVDSFAC